MPMTEKDLLKAIGRQKDEILALRRELRYDLEVLAQMREDLRTLRKQKGTSIQQLEQPEVSPSSWPSST
jgi:hypothetical protein